MLFTIFGGKKAISFFTPFLCSIVLMQNRGQKFRSSAQLSYNYASEIGIDSVPSEGHIIAHSCVYCLMTKVWQTVEWILYFKGVN
jgi:hypothetical protein